jgi:hypothetical protein
MSQTANFFSVILNLIEDPEKNGVAGRHGLLTGFPIRSGMTMSEGLTG